MVWDGVGTGLLFQTPYRQVADSPTLLSLHKSSWSLNRWKSDWQRKSEESEEKPNGEKKSKALNLESSYWARANAAPPPPNKFHKEFYYMPKSRAMRVTYPVL